MAEIKKYLDTTALGTLVDNIKTQDEATLQAAKNYADTTTLKAAKDYADSLAENYEAAGAAATVLEQAKAYADQAELDAVATANAYTDTEVAKAAAAADAAQASAGEAATAAAAAQTQADKGVADAAAAAAAAEAADAKAAQAQAEVDALETLVGALPEGTSASTVVEYVNVKTAGIATDTALEELNNQVSGLQTAVQTIQADYLVEEDKTALQDSIDAVDGRVDVLVGDDADKSVRTIANEELAKQLIAEGAQESLDTLAEIAAWIQAHPDDAAAMNKAISDLETLVGELPEGVTATTVVGYIQEAVAAEKSRAEGVEAELSGRLDDVEAALGTGTGSVADQIATAKAEAISAAADDAAAKDVEVLADAKEYADGLNTAMNARVEALEAVDHEHSNLELLETYTQTEADLADAVAKKHAHENADVLAGITAENVTAWGNSLTDAKAYADGLNTTMQSTVDGVASRVSTLETASASHALQTDLEAAVARIAVNEANIASNTSAINSFTAITSDEVNALFA